MKKISVKLRYKKEKKEGKSEKKGRVLVQEIKNMEALNTKDKRSPRPLPKFFLAKRKRRGSLKKADFRKSPRP